MRKISERIIENVSFKDGHEFRDYLWDIGQTMTGKWAPGFQPTAFLVFIMDSQGLNIASAEDILINPKGDKRFYYESKKGTFGGHLFYSTMKNVIISRGILRFTYEGFQFRFEGFSF